MGAKFRVQVSALRDQRNRNDTRLPLAPHKIRADPIQVAVGIKDGPRKWYVPFHVRQMLAFQAFPAKPASFVID